MRSINVWLFKMKRISQKILIWPFLHLVTFIFCTRSKRFCINGLAINSIIINKAYFCIRAIVITNEASPRIDKIQSIARVVIDSSSNIRCIIVSKDNARTIMCNNGGKIHEHETSSFDCSVVCNV